MEKKTLDKKQVAAVCGNQVLIFGRQRSNGTRPFKESSVFGNYGQALAFATEFDENERRKEALGLLRDES
jgi:hypothetical protein